MPEKKHVSIGAPPGLKTLSLNGGWRLSASGGGKSCGATVPGCVHTDLMNAGAIPDPFYSTHELDLQWISDNNWTYRRAFEVDRSFMAKRMLLACEGLDTVATVKVNGKTVGRAENMFRRYDFDVTKVLVAGTNTVKVEFLAPTRYGEKRSLEIPYEIPGSEYHWPLGQDTITYRNQLRKAQFQFGWDWAPCLPTMGIWKDISLFSYDQARLEHVSTRQVFSGKDVTLEVVAHLQSLATGSLKIRAVLARSATEGSRRQAETVCKTVRVIPGARTCSLKLAISRPALWYPNGHGAQPLYPLTVEIMDGDEVLDVRQFKIGFRNIELIRKPDATGESFFFKVNGIPVFAKGANWVPADSFPSRISGDKYEFLLQSAVDANMNMLRVWGGGIYESDRFYDLCDEKGILVWQDFLFACCAYPATPEFLENVSQEARQQIRRLKNHACLALWCGNNENEGVERTWGRNKKHSAWLGRDYRKLGRVLEQACRREDGDRPYWPASPHLGGMDSGDEHFWKVGSNREPFSDYLMAKPRFVSEFGFQSLPTIHTVRSMVAKEDLNVSSPAMEHHQRKKGWNPLLLDYIGLNFRFPSSMAHISYLSQLNQALAMKTAVEHWRRCKPWTMGTLYWQYNDCWPAVSWAGIDGTLNWKALHYFARRFYGALLVSFLEKDESVELWLTSDRAKSTAGSIVIQIWRTDGELLDRVEQSFTLKAQQSRRMTALTLKQILRYGNRKEDTVLHAKVVGADDLACNTHVLVPYKYLDIRPPEIQCSFDVKRQQILLDAKRPAFFVKLDAPGGGVTFKDNYFNLLPDVRVSVPQGKRAVGGKPWFAKNLDVMSLADIP